nr:ABC transporter transmembrane domain-containing protein [uncultured Sphaerochaeta sp.]
MLNIIRRRFALSRKGAKDFVTGTLWTTVQNITLMLPAVYMFSFLDEYLSTVFGSSTPARNGYWYYVLLGFGFMVIMFLIAVFQYRSTYTTVYEESANRRISLAEKLRRLPLAFFGERNLSDLTSTIMEDCTDLEHTFSHAVPQLFASVLECPAHGNRIVPLQLATLSRIVLGCAFFSSNYPDIEENSAKGVFCGL